MAGDVDVVDEPHVLCLEEMSILCWGGVVVAVSWAIGRFAAHVHSRRARIHSHMLYWCPE